MTSLQNEDFARLAERVASARDRAAFGQLFDHFAPRINGYLQRLGLSAAQSEELTQEVMIVLWHKACLFDPAKSSLATWLFRVARNRRIDMLRREKTRAFDTTDPFFQPEPEGPADGQIDAQRRDERIRIALRDLPEEQVELIRYAFFMGLTHSQIAERANLPLGTVKSRIRLAFGRLRKILTEDPMVDVD